MKTKVASYDEQNPPEPSDIKSDLAIGVKVTGLNVYVYKKNPRHQLQILPHYLELSLTFDFK